MDVDFSIELGADDPALEFPWSSDDEGLRYFDLKSHPELLSDIEEAVRYPELREFLSAVNSANSALLTAKCDVWTETELSEAEDIYEAKMKFCSYIDVLLDEKAANQRFDFECHGKLVRRLTESLNDAVQIPAAAEFIVRRCYFQAADQEAPHDSRAGFYITFYLFGYGDDEEEARQRWATGLKRVQNAILKVTGEAGRS